MTFAERIGRFITSEHLLEPGARVVVGFSGGADSSALLAVLTELGHECIAAHCHFGLRGAESDRDLEHSRSISSRLGCDFRSIRFPTREYMRRHGVSAEMACRELRYDFFERLRAETGAEAIAVGHHREDNAETFFLNLLRGSGLHGLRAMLPRRGRIIRPLLEVSRTDILSYLSERSLQYIEDSTNASNDFKRNRLRNKVLPLLEAEFPGASEAINRSISLLRANEELYNELIPPMQGNLNGVGRTLLHEWIAPFGFNPSQCADILSASSGARFDSSTHCLTLLPGGRYSLSRKGEEADKPVLTGKIYPRPDHFSPIAGRLYLSADNIDLASARWELRPWQPGDRIRPFGMKGTKPVSDLLAGANVAATDRRNRYVLTLNDQILWIVGIRASALFPVMPSTRNIIEIHHHEDQ